MSCGIPGNDNASRPAFKLTLRIFSKLVETPSSSLINICRPISFIALGTESTLSSSAIAALSLTSIVNSPVPVTLTIEPIVLNCSTVTITPDASEGMSIPGARSALVKSTVPWVMEMDETADVILLSADKVIVSL